jgi:hypothetical protein
MRKVLVLALLATPVLCAWLGMDLAQSCENLGNDHDTAEIVLAVVGSIALGLATGLAIRVHWLPRAIIAVLAAALVFGGIVSLEMGTWLNECD